MYIGISMCASVSVDDERGKKTTETRVGNLIP